MGKKRWWEDKNLPRLLCRRCHKRNAVPTGESQHFGALSVHKDRVLCPDCLHGWWSVALVPTHGVLEKGG